MHEFSSMKLRETQTAKQPCDSMRVLWRRVRVRVCDGDSLGCGPFVQTDAWVSGEAAALDSSSINYARHAKHARERGCMNKLRPLDEATESRKQVSALHLSAHGTSTVRIAQTFHSQPTRGPDPAPAPPLRGWPVDVDVTVILTPPCILI